MKCYFFVALAIFFMQGVTLSQSPCPNPNTNPSIPQPTQLTLVSTTCSTLLVRWQGSANLDYCVTATYFNEATSKKDTALAINKNCTAGQNCTATIPVIPGVQVTWLIQSIDTATRTSSYPVINVLENPISPCGSAGVTFCGKVMLQGAFDRTTGKMSNTLNTLGLLQSKASSQPYNNTTFNYAGTESVTAGFFATHPEIVDWVLLELRDANAPSSAVGRRAVFVRQDGKLVDVNGTDTLITFPGVAMGQYYVAVRHRNHLGIRTATPLDFSCPDNCFDFTTGSFNSFKNKTYPSPVQMGTVWLMRGGNANFNTSIRYSGLVNDMNQILNVKLGGDIFKTIFDVYTPEDVNMNGNIRWSGLANDMNLLLNIALGGSIFDTLEEQF